MTEYNDMTYPELQAAAKDRRLNAGGSKAELVERLTEADSVPVDDETGEPLTGTEITEKVADEQGVDAQNARAYDSRGNVRPADARWLGENNDGGDVPPAS